VSPLREEVRAATRRLSEAGVASPDADAVALAAHVLGIPAAEVRRLMVLDAKLCDVGAASGAVVAGSAGFVAAYHDLVGERTRRVPLQHLTGRAAFRYLELQVGPGVFVPRPETELAAGLAIEAAAAVVSVEGRAPRVVDLCCGSGAIALSAKSEAPRARVHGVELSELALAWAIRNRDLLGLDVDLRLGDATTAFQDLVGEVDVVVSNPPYIPLGAVPNDPEVRDHDPEVALYGGSADGLAIPLAVAARAAVLLRPGGVLVMEHADVQGAALTVALRRAGEWDGIRDHRDLSGLPRAVTARRR